VELTGLTEQALDLRTWQWKKVRRGASEAQRVSSDSPRQCERDAEGTAR
jgi:hypothetical protein